MPLQFPHSTEYNPYFQTYLDLVKDSEFDRVFNDGIMELRALLQPFEKALEDFAYQPGKWSVKELVQHITDTDRVFSYRALVAARGDLKTVLYSMDENQYALAADVTRCSLGSLLDELEAVRRSFYLLVKDMKEEDAFRPSHVEGHPVTARAMAWISAGHIKHHISVIRNRYIPAAGIL